MKIYGKIIREPSEKHYYGIPSPGADLYALGDSKSSGGHIRRTIIAGCSGKANQFIGGEYYSPKDTMSWGYDGNGSDLLAAWLIMRGLSMEHIMNESYTVFSNEPADRDIMLRHYKQFSKEVIANLPDEWGMDTSWVRQWVMDREAKTA